MNITLLCSLSEGISAFTIANDGYLYVTLQDALYRIKTTEYNPTLDLLYQQENARFSGITFDGNNKLYIGEQTNNEILSFDTQTQYVEVFAGNNDKAVIMTDIGTPDGITIDRDGNIYFTEWVTYITKIDMKNKTVHKIAGSKQDEVYFKDGPANEAKFLYPGGIRVCDDGTIYVADMGNYCVRKIKDGIVSTVAGTPNRMYHGSTGLGFVHSLYVDDHGDVCIVDSEVMKIDQRNHKLIPIHLPYKEPHVATMDSEGTLYVAYADKIVRIDKRWKWERLLWIGHLKNDASYCKLARLPKDLIREISSHLVVKPPVVDTEQQDDFGGN